MLPWMQVQVKRFYFFVTAAQSQKSFINTLPPQVSMETSLATAHMCECLGERMDCLLTHWVYVCEREIAYGGGGGGMRASVSPSKYICV